MLKKRCALLLAANLAILLVAPATAQVVGRAVSTGGNLFESFNQVDPDYDYPGDMFGIRSRANPDPPGSTMFNGLPFAVADDSLTLDPGPDRNGIIGTTDFDDFFGVVDTINDDSGIDTNDTNIAMWTFNISSLTEGVKVSVDMAAMGDFETSNDFYNFTYSIDGSAAAPLFSSVIDEDDMQDYTMEDGVTINSLNDPALVNTLDNTESSILLNNNFQNISADLAGTGLELEITFTAQSDGGEEAFAFRNLIIEGGMEPAPPGDFDKDHDIDGDDFLIWQSNFPTAEGATSNSGDATNDGAVNGDDFLIWQAGFGTGSGGGASVPEPTSGVLVVLCCCGVLVGRNKR